LSHNPVPLKKAYDQLTGIEHWVRSDVEARLKILSKEIVKQYPVLGDTFALTLDDSLCSFQCAFQPEDDLNPFQLPPLTDKDFEQLNKGGNFDVILIRFFSVVNSCFGGE
jgi:hypothetical protein